MVAGLVLAATPARAELPAMVIDGAQRNILELRLDGNRWNTPSYLGTHYLSQYFLMLHWLQRTDTRLDPEQLKKRLLASQLGDGSWYAIKDANVREGDLNATVLNYWALKAMGAGTGDPVLARARAFILSHGGLEGAGAFMKVWLALFGNGSWDFMPKVPYSLFNTNLPLSHDDFAQWVGPHLMPIAYLRELERSRDLGAAFRLDELWLSDDARKAVRAGRGGRPHLPGDSERALIRFILGRQQPMGSFGAYTVATLLSAAAFDDFARHHPELAPRLAVASDRALAFVETRYFDSGQSSYLGVLDDGHYWDTALMGIALQDSGVPPAQLRATADYLLRSQSSNGGFPFGVDFGYAPDTDDTAEILLFLRPHTEDPRVARFTELAARWLERMQSSDGGWGAFSKDNQGNWLLRSSAGALSDSVDLFDESSPDVTGHILEGLAAYGRTKESSKAARAAIAYLKATQEKSGAWWGRWGINYLYGTGAAVVGLVRAGESPAEPYLVRAVDWLASKQNADGGFGETSRSYADPSLAGVGVSTPSQTAWVLLALVESGRARSPAAERAAAYLTAQFEEHGRWIDSSTVGTGHPGIIYMNYPSYPYAFPLTALARYALKAGPGVGSGVADQAAAPPAKRDR